MNFAATATHGREVVSFDGKPSRHLRMGGSLSTDRRADAVKTGD
jgi:hypothetical protein